MLARAAGALGKPLRCVTRDEAPPDDFANDDEQCMCGILLTGDACDKGNKKAHQKLKAFLVGAPSHPWIEAHDHAEDGRAAHASWAGHCNRRAELSKHATLAKARLHSLRCKSERSLPFESCAGVLERCFLTLAKDPEEARSGHQQVKKLLEGIKADNVELRGAKAVAHQSHPGDFDGDCACCSRAASEPHGDAQVEHQCGRGQKCCAHAVE